MLNKTRSDFQRSAVSHQASVMILGRGGLEIGFCLVFGIWILEFIWNLAV
jgi:hypothetical protein